MPHHMQRIAGRLRHHFGVVVSIQEGRYNFECECDMQITGLCSSAPAHSSAGCLRAPGLIKLRPRSRPPSPRRQAAAVMASAVDTSQLKPFEEGTNWKNVMPPGCAACSDHDNDQSYTAVDQHAY